MSAIDALNKITERYAKKSIKVRHLSADCRQLLHTMQKKWSEVNIMEDPTYKVAVD
jgi:uncharacterized membrane protein